MNKSLILKSEILEELQSQLVSFIPYNFGPLDGGFKYLGYFLKPNSYHVNDWLCLLKKIDSRINVWCNCWLSLGGRLVLLKSVLESILIYWLSLAKVPKSIFDWIRKNVLVFFGQAKGKKRLYLR